MLKCIMNLNLSTIDERDMSTILSSIKEDYYSKDYSCFYGSRESWVDVVENLLYCLDRGVGNLETSADEAFYSAPHAGKVTVRAEYDKGMDVFSISIAPQKH